MVRLKPLTLYTYLTLWGTFLFGVGSSLPSPAIPSTPSNDLPPLTARDIANGVDLRILPLGDSITWGYSSSDGNGYRQKLLSQLTPNGNKVTYVGSRRSGNMANGNNEGHPGATIEQIASFAPAGTASRPNVVLLMAGTNDMNTGVEPGTAPQRLGSLIGQVSKACPDAVIVVAQITPIRDNGHWAGFNAALPAVVQSARQSHNKIILVNMGSSLQAAGDLADGLHPNDGGYAKMAQVWYQGIVQAGINGWISKPVSAPGGGGGSGGKCIGNLYWDPKYGQIASGVGVGGGGFPKGKWINRGIIHKGHVAPKDAGGAHDLPGLIHMADLNGDGLDDYIWVSMKSGMAWAYLNTGDFDNWEEVGQVASGIGDLGEFGHNGVIFADIDGDGKDDYLWVTVGGSVSYFRNGGRGGDGKWIWYPEGEIVTTQRGIGRSRIRFADLDGDGRADLIILGENGSSAGYLNVGVGNKPNFRAMGIVASGAGEKSAVQFEDINGDGRADYLVVSESSAVTAYANLPDDKFGAAPWWWGLEQIASGVAEDRLSVTWGDINGDGKADYIAVNYGESKTGDSLNYSITAWQNAGSGATYRAGQNIFLADLDGDGRQDYLIVNPSGGIELYLNGGVGADNKWIWYPQGQIASGVGARKNIRFGDLDGDGKADYLVIDPDTSAVHFWQNGGKQSNGQWLWIDRGQVAGGAGFGKGAGVRMADLDGDGKVDFIYLTRDGKAHAYLNGGPCAACEGGWLWISKGQIADGVGVRREDIIFADIDGDGRADYLTVDPLNGAVTMYRNGGPGTPKWIWYPITTPIATGVGSNGAAVRFADLNGDGRADYLRLSIQTGALTMWYNGCTQEEVPPPEGNPSVPQDPIHNYGDGRACVDERFDHLEDMPSGTSQVCVIIHSLETFAKQIREDVNEFEDILANQWDRKFQIYANYFVAFAFEMVEDYIRSSSDKFFDCAVSERIHCCSDCQLVLEPDHWEERCRYCLSREDRDDGPCHPNFPSSDPPFEYRVVDERCPPNYDDRGVGGNADQSVRFRLKPDVRWQDVALDMQKEKGINASFVEPATYRYDWSDNAYTNECGRDDSSQFCKHNYLWYGAPILNDDYGADDMANPKDQVEATLPRWRSLPGDLEAIAADLRNNEFRIEGERVDPVIYAYMAAVPASLLNETLVHMREIVETADEIEEAAREQLITGWLSVLGAVLGIAAPFVAPMLSIAGRGAVGVWSANALMASPILTSWGLAIYSAVDEPENAFFYILSALLGGGFRLKTQASVAALRIEANGDLMAAFGHGALNSNVFLMASLPAIPTGHLLEDPPVDLPELEGRELVPAPLGMQ